MVKGPESMCTPTTTFSGLSLLKENTKHILSITSGLWFTYTCMRYIIMYVHMFISMYVCMYICMYVCVYVCTRVWVSMYVIKTQTELYNDHMITNI